MNRKTHRVKWSGLLDLTQSISGILLAIFLWVHLCLVASILLGAEAMQWVAKTMELSFLSADGHGYPWVVTVMAVLIGVLILLHVLVALHKLPLTLKQQRALNKQMHVIPHEDTKLWRWQAITGVIVLLAAPVHLWLVGAAPETIGPYGSADRIWNQGGWLLYVPLLLAVELHAAVGIYRVVLKWGLAGDDMTRIQLRKAKSIASAIFILVGLASLVAFMPHAS
ncbi:fumarate reductase cytochrome b subunit [Shewanella gelidii]|uniref:Fumarate reductase n=1 Tax=Shewanella gelidii TaxID=1642821 RepID=A0A917NDU6_9GAMM|nr:fumarate reductase cytochrome b subunit [Shewanella gelidii]MCL1098718.1 fumarate reductase cytochrome b subunit [Shewanella gelidii]GGI88124.1 fumarate reductase [Shewanella gelidii]